MKIAICNLSPISTANKSYLTISFTLEVFMKVLIFAVIVIITSVGMSMLRGKTVSPAGIQLNTINTDAVIVPSLQRASELNTGYSDATRGTELN